MGDSFSSGEGTSAGDGSDFFRGSDHHGSEPFNQNACHRSPYAWPYKIDVPNVSGYASVGTLASANDPRLDFNMLACAGAETKNMLPTEAGSNYATDQQYGERTQLDRGFLDANTTLVTLTIGGNDVGFGPILQACITSPGTFASPATECKVDPAPAGTGFSGTIEQMVDSRLAALPGKITTVLQEIKERAVNARIVLLGYPTLFENGTLCVALSEMNKSWLNSVSQRLNQALTKAAFDAGAYVTYESPQYRFSGHNVCADNPALRRLVLTTTPGDAGTWIQPPDAPGYGISAQSVHPNQFGTDLYAQAANNAVATERVPLAATLTAGAPTTYYSTLRWMEGPTAMSVSSFSSCGQELRLGLRSGAAGTQTSNSLSWTSPHDKQNFLHAPDSLNTPDLPGNTYAMNARLTTACPGGGKPDVDRRSLPLARTSIAAAVLLLTGGLAGCDSGQQIHEEAATEAEHGVALALENTTTQTTDLLAERSALSEITIGDISAIFLTDARSHETEPLDAIQTRALFGLTENSDGSVTFSVFIVDSVYRASGLVTTSQSRYSCGEIIGRFGEGVLSVEDLDCPPVFVQRAGEDSVNVSMTANAEKYGVSVGTSP